MRCCSPAAPYYSKPGGIAATFHADTVECAREYGIQSPNKQVAVPPDVYRRCMLARGWTREKRMEPVEAGWFRAVEKNEPFDITAGPKKPEPSTANSEIFCRARRLDDRSDWRVRLPAYRECLKQ